MVIHILTIICLYWTEKSLPIGRLAVRLLVLSSRTKASLGEGKKEGEEKQVCIHHIHSLHKQYTLINLMLLFLSIKKRAQIERVRENHSYFIVVFLGQDLIL